MTMHGRVISSRCSGDGHRSGKQQIRPLIVSMTASHGHKRHQQSGDRDQNTADDTRERTRTNLRGHFLKLC